MVEIAAALIAATASVVTTWMTLRASRHAPPRTAAPPDEAREPQPLPRPNGLEGVWQLFSALPPLGRPVRTWLAALLGFLFSGFGIALYFRKLPDVLVGIAFLLPLGLASSGRDTASEEPATIAWWYWIFAALASLYALLRAESANRRLGEA